MSNGAFGIFGGNGDFYDHEPLDPCHRCGERTDGVIAVVVGNGMAHVPAEGNRVGLCRSCVDHHGFCYWCAKYIVPTGDGMFGGKPALNTVAGQMAAAGLQACGPCTQKYGLPVHVNVKLEPLARSIALDPKITFGPHRDLFWDSSNDKLYGTTIAEYAPTPEEVKSLELRVEKLMWDPTLGIREVVKTTNVGSMEEAHTFKARSVTWSVFKVEEYCEHAPPRSVVEAAQLVFSERMLVEWERHEKHAKKGARWTMQYVFDRMPAVARDQTKSFTKFTNLDTCGPIVDQFGGTYVTHMGVRNDFALKHSVECCTLCGGLKRQREVRSPLEGYSLGNINDKEIG